MSRSSQLAIVTLTMNPSLDIATSTKRVVPMHKLRCDAPRRVRAAGIQAQSSEQGLLEGTGHE